MDDIDAGGTVELPEVTLTPSMAFDEIDKAVRRIYPYSEM